jgi:hypothetical protein
MDQSSGATPKGRREPTSQKEEVLPVNEFIRPLSADSHQDDEPTSSAELSIVLELAPGATIGELVCRLAKAILIALSDCTSAGHRGNRRKTSQGQLHLPGS